MSDLFMNMQRRRRATIAARNDIHTSNSVHSTGSSTETAATKSKRSAGDRGPVSVDDADADEFENVLSLQLRKPKHWKWELTTSKSCSNIAMPRILLYDHTGALLVDANSPDEQTYRQPQRETRKRPNRAATANLAQSMRQALDRQFSGLHIQEATPSAPSSNANTAATTPTTPNAPHTSSGATIDFYSNALPDYKLQRRANSLKGVRFQVDDDASAHTNGGSFHVVDLPTPPSTITTTTTATPTNSSSSGPREKRRYRRSHSSGRSPANSGSILERFSFNKGRFSSPEYAEEQEVYHAPRYFLRTSKAGTLVVQEESFSRYRRRRRPKHSSSENIQHDSGSKGSLQMSDAAQRHLTVPIGAGRQCGSLHNVAELQEPTRKKAFPVRRYRSDGNVLLRAQLSTSEEEEPEEGAGERTNMNGHTVAGCMQPQHRKYSSYRRQSKKDLVTIDPDNRVNRAFGSPTGR